MMPALSQEFSINAAQSSLILSVSTAMLALGLLITGPISDTLGRKPVMVAALFCAAASLGILLMRALVGLSLSGLAAVAADTAQVKRSAPNTSAGHGPQYRRRRDWRHERAPDHRADRRLTKLATANADHRRPGLIARPCSVLPDIAQLPRQRPSRVGLVNSFIDAAGRRAAVVIP